MKVQDGWLRRMPKCRRRAHDEMAPLMASIEDVNGGRQQLISMARAEPLKARTRSCGKEWVQLSSMARAEPVKPELKAAAVMAAG